MLRNEIIPAIRRIAGDIDQTWFQQDGASPHFGVDVCAYLNTQFPRRQIGRREEIVWPGRSPDLTALDYFLWGYLKDRVYKTKPRSIEDLCQKIRDEIALIYPDMIQNALSDFYNRVGYCQTVNGERFEHLIK